MWCLGVLLEWLKSARGAGNGRGSAAAGWGGYRGLLCRGVVPGVVLAGVGQSHRWVWAGGYEESWGQEAVRSVGV